MKSLFEHTSASWVHYSDYEWKETKDHQLYLLPTKDAVPSPYDPMKEAESIVLEAMDIGMMLFRKSRKQRSETPCGNLPASTACWVL